MTTPIGWYVRVTTGEVVDGVYDTVLYVVGYSTPAEAEAAVRRARAGSGEQYKVLSEVTAGRGPQPKPGQVWLLNLGGLPDQRQPRSVKPRSDGEAS
jgi:hypothetical protein